MTLIAASWAGTRDPRESIGPVSRLSAAMKRSSASVIVIGDPASQHRDPVECQLARRATMKTCTSRQRAVQAQADTAIATAARRQGNGFVDVRG